MPSTPPAWDDRPTALLKADSDQLQAATENMVEEMIEDITAGMCPQCGRELVECICVDCGID